MLDRSKALVVLVVCGALVACQRSTPSGGASGTASGAATTASAAPKDVTKHKATLTVYKDDVAVAEVVLAQERFVRVDFKTDDAETKQKLQASIDEILARANDGGLGMERHVMLDEDTRGTTYVVTKPGEDGFSSVMYVQLEALRGFTVGARYD